MPPSGITDRFKDAPADSLRLDLEILRGDFESHEIFASNEIDMIGFMLQKIEELVDTRHPAIKSAFFFYIKPVPGKGDRSFPGTPR